MNVSSFTRSIASGIGSVAGAGYGATHGGIGVLPGAARGAAAASTLHDVAVGIPKGAAWGALHSGVGILPGAMIGVSATREGVSMAKAAAVALTRV